MKKLLLTYLVIILASSCMHAQVQVSTDKSQYEIGDYIYVTITINGQPNATYYWPESDVVSPFELITENPIDTVVKGQTLTLTKKMVVSMYDAGDVYFPQLTISYQQKNDTTQYVLVSDSVGLRIQGIDVDTTQNIKPITDVLDVTVKKNIWMWVIIGALALGILAFALWYFLLRKKHPLTLAQPERIVPITERYLLRLQGLENKKLWQQDQRKLYYSELTDILRQYIEERYAVATMEHTSDEIVSQASRHPELRNFVTDIEYVLSLADMAKFAKSHPLADENIRALSLVRSFIEQTPVLEPAKPEA